MKNERKKFSEENILKEEPPVTAKELLEEIKPLLQDYFVGEISQNDDGICYSLPNGQKFILTAQAV